MLARCVGVSGAEFAAEYWSRRPLLSPAAHSAQDFTDLLDLNAIDELLSRRGLRTPFIRMAKQGKVIAPRAFTRSGGQGAGIADQVADDKVMTLLADGATLVLQALHRTWPPLVEFGTRLAVELGHPVQINSYLTPPQNQGFAAHFDTHDVFVLQVSGRKRWVIHRPVLPDPLPEQTWETVRAEVERRVEEPAVLDVMLQPGDALYLPRGYLHSAVAQAETSLHLTVGVHPVTRYALLEHLLTAARSHPELRRSLPLDPQLATEAALAEPLAETLLALQQFVAGEHLRPLAVRVSDQLAGAIRPGPLAPLAQLELAAHLDPHTPVRLRPGLQPRLDAAGARLRLHTLGEAAEFDAATEPALRLLLSGQTVPAGGLPGLDDEAGVDLVRQLLVTGVLVAGG